MVQGSNYNVTWLLTVKTANTAEVLYTLSRHDVYCFFKLALNKNLSFQKYVSLIQIIVIKKKTTKTNPLQRIGLYQKHFE